MSNNKRESEITIAQKIGEVRQLILWQILAINPTFSFSRAQELSEEEVQDLFHSLEDAYRVYFSEK